MKWIKASERLPDKRHNYHVRVRYYQDKPEYWNTASLWNLDHWEHPFRHDSFTGLPKKIIVHEWLDESTSEPIEQPTIDTLRLQQNKNYHAAVEEIKRLKGLIEQFIALRKFLIKESPLTKMMDEIIEKHNL